MRISELNRHVYIRVNQICTVNNVQYCKCLTEVFGLSRPLQVTSVKYRESKNVRVCSCCAVFCVVLAVCKDAPVFR